MNHVAEASGTPKFSIVMPVYNCRPWIREAVLSVLAQTEQSFELIVVDDCSTDGSIEAISDLRARDARIHVIRSMAKGNAASTRNTGLKAAAGAYIAFLDADDLWLPERLSKHRAVFEAHPGAALVFSDFRVFSDEEGEQEPHLMCERKLLTVAAPHFDGPLALRDLEVYRCKPSVCKFMALNYSVLFMHSVTLSRAAMISEPYWFPTDLRVCEDLEFFMRIMEKGLTLFFPQTLAWYRHRGGSLTHESEKFLEGMILFHTANLERCRATLESHEVSAYKARIAGLRSSLGWQLRLRYATARSIQQYWLALRTFPTLNAALLLLRSLIPRPRKL